MNAIALSRDGGPLRSDAGGRASDNRLGKVACGGVQDKFAECGVKTLGKPALFAMGHRHAPEGDGVRLVEYARESGKVEGPVCVWVVHDLFLVAADVRRLKLYF